jgi:trigger factor
MKITLTTPSPLERKIAAEAPWDEFAGELEHAFEEIRKEAVLKGFRKGTAPLGLIRGNFAEEARKEATESLVRKGLTQALAENSISLEKDVVGNPYLIEVGKPVEGAPFTFEAMVELRPVFELPSLAGVRLEKPVRAVTGDDVERFLSELQSQSARPVPLIEDRALRHDDIATLDFSGTVTGREVPGLSAVDYRARIGQGKMVEGFEERIVGMKVGERREFDLPFPADFPGKDLAGQTVHFTATLKAVHTLHLPPLDDEFARSVSRAGDLAELRKLVRDDLVRMQEEEAQRAVRANLVRKLLDLAPFDVPPGMVDEELKIVAGEHGERLVRAGLPPEKVRERILADGEAMKKGAAERVRLSFLMLAAAERGGVTVDDGEIASVLDEIARQTGKPLAKVVKEYEERGGIEEIHFSLLRQKVVDRLLTEAEVVEVPAKEEVTA